MDELMNEWTNQENVDPKKDTLAVWREEVRRLALVGIVRAKNNKRANVTKKR